MRVGGLATGMDIDSIVKDLMTAERIPLDKMEQEKTYLTWQRNAYREVNKQLAELEKLAMEMKYQSSYNNKIASSSNPESVTVNANSNAGNGNYSIHVTQLATQAYRVSDGSISGTTKIDPDGKLSEQDFANGFSEGSFTIKTHTKDGEKSHTFEITGDKSLNDVLQEMNNADIGVRVFYEESSDKIMMERTEAGNYNAEGSEMTFEGDNVNFLTNTLQLGNENGGQDAKFTYNGVMEITSHDNEYTINGMELKLNKVTADPVNINVTNDVDGAVEGIMKFVDTYNKFVEEVQKGISEKPNREFKPLTEAQRKEMDEKEIELWEEQAKKGLLYNDPILGGALSTMRVEWYESVKTSGQYSNITEIGITTSFENRDGKLVVDEEKLRSALTEDPESVTKLFVGEGEIDGIADKLQDAAYDTMKKIERKAGKPSMVDSSYSMGREMRDLKDEMNDFEGRLTKVENRYWREFTAMEKAIQQMNSQSMYLMQQFG
ncbi:flagellar hook-associated protein 2 [Pontibacillus litoralis]|uniref:Flagellar hook-associated protein 2 n=1 Tax=Pontibacillus litoralis JSM 072002 TaxID=1385512 RepID=A0A0A5FZP4_9BACI|nr:flagellar hook-associated protein 2 [Pontibacillus litoralis]KGX86306.1 hypothetical protein N784_04990 [Pontibacillus litoralis JSM 072002]